MKIWKNILLLTALPITTFIMPQVLSSCYNTKNEQSNDNGEKKDIHHLILKIWNL